MKIHEFGNTNADIVLVQPVIGRDLEYLEKETELVRDLSGKDFYLLAVEVEDWNRDLSPWKAPAVFGKEDFGGEAQKTLDEIVKLCADMNKTYYIGGYSLAGLFALWSVYQTDIFKGVAAASASMWYPDFINYIKEHTPHTDAVYLSLGDKESKTKNPMMATVRDKAEEAYNLFIQQGIRCTFEFNSGNHFQDVDIRTAKAFSWVLKK